MILPEQHAPAPRPAQPTPPTLTDRQREVLAMVRASIDEHGAPPTRQDICDHFGFASPNSAEEYLVRLQTAGAIELVRGRARNIRIVTDETDADRRFLSWYRSLSPERRTTARAAARGAL